MHNTSQQQQINGHYFCSWTINQKVGKECLGNVCLMTGPSQYLFSYFCCPLILIHSKTVQICVKYKIIHRNVRYSNVNLYFVLLQVCNNWWDDYCLLNFLRISYLCNVGSLIWNFTVCIIIRITCNRLQKYIIL